MFGNEFAKRIGRTLTIAAIAVAFVGAAEPVSAATIIWGSPTTVAGDSDVDTTGTLVYAYNIGPSGVQATTINGVVFNAFAFPGQLDFLNTVTVGSVNFTENPSNLQSYDFPSSATPFASLSTAYKTMLSGGGTALLDSTITATLGGLTAGQSYRLQWWTSDPANSQGVLNETFATTTATSGSSSVTLDSNSTNASGGLGQYVIGTFTADSTTQTFDLNSPSGNTSPLINGFQIRAVAVPEPSTCAMATTAALGVAAAALRRFAGRRFG
ncbi:MAG: hypothetical protein KGR24_05460 [Planctomycetes bacterium]|nr:hypothetical protein [Planctomycetota bacterium]